MTSVRILTLPAGGPYHVGQTVQFNCEVNPRENVTITWNFITQFHSSSSGIGRSFNWTFQLDTLRYSVFSCTVVANRSVVGKAAKVIEIQGKLVETLFCSKWYWKRCDQ